MTYTECSQYNDPKNVMCYKLNLTQTKCVCRVNFTIQHEIDGPVYFYYGLNKFYQNHFHYIRSRDDDQLYGLEAYKGTYCEPYFVDPSGRKYAPCGAIAR